MSNAIEQLFASGVPSMAQLARMKREENKTKQENNECLVANDHRHGGDPALIPSLAINETTHEPSIRVLQTDTNFIPHSAAPVQHGANSDTSISRLSAPDVQVEKSPLVKASAIPLTHQSNSPTSYNPLKISQPRLINSNIPLEISNQKASNDHSTKPKKKKRKKYKQKKVDISSFKQQHQVDHKVLWRDSEDAINRGQDDLDDFDMLLKAHEQPGKGDNVARQTVTEFDGPENIQDVALNRKSESHKGKKNNKRKQTTDGDRPHDQQRTKRKVQEITPFVPRIPCKYWEEGYCINGDQCTFLHAGEKKSNIPVCRHFIFGACKNGDLCPFSHTLKDEACRHFHVKGICLSGPDCPYAHENASPAALAAMSSKNTPCRFYHLKGYCNSGDACLYSHGNQSTRRLSELKDSETCKYYLKGRCVAGDDCLFSHVVNTTTQPVPPPQYREPATLEQTPLAGFQLTFD